MSSCEDPPQDILLDGEGMEEEQCMLELSEQSNAAVGCLEEVVELHPIGEHCYVNEVICDDSVTLIHGAIVQFGTEHLLRFNNPVVSAQMRARGDELKLRPARLVGGASYEEEAKLKADDAALKEEKRIMDLERHAFPTAFFLFHLWYCLLLG